MRDSEEEKLSPDELLKAIQKKESQHQLGKLKIFFGMSPGVGKTYAMLEEAHQRLKNGLNVVVGTINTHGRKETQGQLEGLPIIPEKWIKYKDTVFEELDVETIIDAKPDLVLVDELAHTNMPGSKHPKRWQDVFEILDAGIDVYTTLNVQHVESRKDLVESLTEIQVRETVPDLVLERAFSIELIDIPPPELLKRLQEGKVYLGDQSRIAANNFFQEENLMALREIALRFTAEKVDHDLHGMLYVKGWKTRERILLSLDLVPSSERLIRAARRLAFELDAPWIVVYVDTGVTLSDQQQTILNKHFNLARELGAEVVTTHDLDVAAALKRITKQRDITRIVIGRTIYKTFNFKSLFQRSLIDRLERENPNVDILILKHDKARKADKDFVPDTQKKISWTAYGIAVLVIGGVTLAGLILNPLLGYKSLGFLFLISILLLSFFVSRGPILAAVILSTLSWNYLFMHPPFSFALLHLEDIVLLIFYFIAATILSAITSKLYEQDQYLKRREKKAVHLYEIEHDIANASNLHELRANVCPRLENIFPGNFDILSKNSDGQLMLESQLPQLLEEKEKVAAEWVFRNGKVGGWSTETLPSAAGIYFPIKFSKSVVGVLAYFPKKERSLSMEEMNFVQTVAQQLAIFLERSIIEEKIKSSDYSSQIEKTHQSIFQTLHHSFHIPLKEISKLNHQIQKIELDPQIQALAAKMERLITNIKFNIDNIIAISELESGYAHFHRKKHAIKDLIDRSIKEVNPFLDGRPLDVEIPSDLIYLTFDFNLLKLALNNLLLNAIQFTPQDSRILIQLQALEGGEFLLSILDEGVGIPDDVLLLMFDKFHPISKSSSGLGLGLAIVKSVANIHRGKFTVKKREEKGTESTLILPM